MPSSNLRALILFSVMTMGALTSAQTGQRPTGQDQKEQSDSPLRIRTELVQIDVVAKDQKGNLIRDLRREDFEIFEDGNPQSLIHYSVGAAGRAAVALNADSSGAGKNSEPRVPSSPASQGRHIVLAVDDYHLAAESLLAVKRALTQFVERELGSDDQVAMAATSGALGLYQQFTFDRSVIKHAIDRLSLQNRAGTNITGIPQISDYQAELIEEGDPGALQIALEEMKLRQGKPPSGFNPARRVSNASDPDESVVRAKARDIVTQNAQYTVVTLSSLETVIRSLRQLPGRKIMVLLSDGFFTESTRSFASYDIRRVTDAATRAGVVIYSIDGRGLVAKPTLGSASDLQSSTITRAPEARKRAVQGEIGARQASLYTLARDTGGLPFYNNNDLGAGLKRVLEDNESYYLLAYEPTNTSRDGHFRKIEVRVTSRPGIQIQTRAGYFAPIENLVETAPKKTEKPSKKAAQEAFDAKLSRFRSALTSLVPLRGIPLDMAAHFVHAFPGGSLALITARIDSSGLSFESQSGGRPSTLAALAALTTLEVLGVILDENGKTVSSFNHSFELNRGDPAQSQAQKGYLNYHNVVPLAPGLYNVRLAIADGEMKQVGSAFDWVVIPDLKQNALTLSSVFLAEEGKDIEDIYNALAATLQSRGAKENSGESGANPLRPARRFKRGSNLDFLLFAYNAQKNAQGTGGISIQLKVIARGQIIYTSPSSEMPLNTDQPGNATPCVARLPLDYEPGNYDLRIDVTDQTSKQTSTRIIAFTVE